ncbi:MAG: hypothetical protein AB1498_02145 [bacterium]
MPEADYKFEYKNKIRPQLNRQFKKIILSFIFIIFLLLFVSMVIDYLNLPDRIIFLFFFPCAVIYLYQIYSLEDIKCPNCNKLLFTINTVDIRKILIIFKTHGEILCPHCNVKLQ